MQDFATNKGQASQSRAASSQFPQSPTYIQAKGMARERMKPVRIWNSCDTSEKVIQRFLPYPVSRIEKPPKDNIGSTIQLKSFPVIQREHKEIAAPSEKELALLEMFSGMNKEEAEKRGYVKKGTHGTNWMHAASILCRIKGIVPKEDRTSEVTPEEGGFWVDTSESGEAHAPEFAEMAAFGTPKEEVLPDFKDPEFKNVLKRNESHEQKFKEHVAKGKGKKRGVILDIYGPDCDCAEPRKEGLQSDEEVYRKNAGSLLATINGFL